MYFFGSPGLIPLTLFCYLKAFFFFYFPSAHFYFSAFFDFPSIVTISVSPKRLAHVQFLLISDSIFSLLEVLRKKCPYSELLWSAFSQINFFSGKKEKWISLLLVYHIQLLTMRFFCDAILNIAASNDY